MARRTERFTVRQLGEEFFRRLEELHAKHGGNNLRVAMLKAESSLTYLARWEDPKSPERLTDGETIK